MANYLLPGWWGTSSIYIIFSGGTELNEDSLYNMTLVLPSHYTEVNNTTELCEHHKDTCINKLTSVLDHPSLKECRDDGQNKGSQA